jgi:hypothetical protein
MIKEAWYGKESLECFSDFPLFVIIADDGETIVNTPAMSS